MGFTRAGEVRSSSLTFSTGRDTLAITAGARIAPGQSPFNLYVLHDPAWRPTYPSANLDAYIIGGAERAEYLVRK